MTAQRRKRGLATAPPRHQRSEQRTPTRSLRCGGSHVTRPLGFTRTRRCGGTVVHRNTCKAATVRGCRGCGAPTRQQADKCRHSTRMDASPTPSHAATLTARQQAPAVQHQHGTPTRTHHGGGGCVASLGSVRAREVCEWRQLTRAAAHFGAVVLHVPEVQDARQQPKHVRHLLHGHAHGH